MRSLGRVGVVAWCTLGTGTGAAAQESGGWITEVERPFYFAVSVSNIDRSVQWYQAALGLQLVDDTRADDGRWRIANLRNERVFVEIIWEHQAPAVPDARGIGKVGFQVPDLDAVARRVESSTGESPRILEFATHGIRILQLRDPDGNIVQLSAPLRRS